VKRLLFIALLVISPWLISSTPALAASDWRISRFHSDISLQPDGKVKVTESITADFSVAKHGIFRDIPYQYRADKDTLYTEVSIFGVERDGQREPYETSRENGYVRLKIGDGGKTITGAHKYTVTYFASGLLRGFEDYDELYWNATGNNWDIPIEQASATVKLPRQQILQTSCYEGPVGSNDECPDTIISPLQARFSATGPLAPGEGLTVAVGYTKGIVPLLSVEKPKTTADLVAESAQQPSSWLLLGLSVIAGLTVPVALWWKRGRDWSWGVPGILSSGQTARLKPLGGSLQVVAEFTPPENLRPAELGLLLDERVDTLDVTSTIVDLAARGYVTIVELEKKWILGSQDYELRRTDKPDADLLAYERLLLSRLFADGTVVKLSSLKNSFYDDLAEVKKAVYENLKQRQYFVDDPSAVRTRYALIGLAIALVGGGLLWLALAQQFIWLAIIALAPFLAGLGTVVWSRAMAQRTALGSDVYRRALG
jgi:hypothetical protein